MDEFSINIGKITSIAEQLDDHAGELKDAGNSISDVENRLRLESSEEARVISALKSANSNVENEASGVTRMAGALRQIAALYRSAENNIIGKMESSGLSGGGDSSGEGETGSGGTYGDGSQNGNNKNSSMFSSDPVNLSTGNFILNNMDMEIPGFQSFSLGRFYNSQGNFTGMLGSDWNTNFERRLIKNPARRMTGADISVFLEDGREEYFASSDGKNFVPVTGTTAELSRKENGYIYQTLDGEYYHFDENGRFERFENAHHVGYDLTYEGDRLVQVQKDSGEFFAFTYGEGGLLSSAEDHTGRTCSYVFENGHLSQVILPDGVSYQYSYDQRGKISRVLNPRLVDAVETEYDERYRVVFQKFADGTTNRFEYRDAEQAVVMTERNGSRSIHYHNDKMQNIRNVYSDGEESFEYNERGQKTMAVDKLGNATHFQYDNKGNLTGILTPDRTKIFATYNQQNRLLTVSVNGKRRVRNQYNSFGDLLSEEDALGRKRCYSYDDSGRITEILMPDKTAMNVSYDERSNVSTLREPNGGIHVYEYDERNQLIGQTDALGRKNSYTYDALGRLLTKTRADGRTRHLQYDEWGNVVSEIGFDGSVMSRTYDGNNNLLSVVDAAGRQTNFEYDTMWNIAKAVLPNGGIFRYLYNENNRLESVRDAEGNETHYVYDAMGNVLTETDAKGAETHYAWDANGRCIKVTAADGSATEFRYDADGNVVYVKDAEGIELNRVFDDAGQLVEETDSIGHIRRYTYSENGDVSSIEDEHGRKTSVRYADGLRKPEEILRPDGTSEHYSYDLSGNLLTYTDIYGAVLHYQYDELNRLTVLTGAGGKTMEYTYDLIGRVILQKDFEGNLTRYEYSPAGQLSAVIDALGNTTRYEYDEMDELIGVLREIPGKDEPMRLSYERNRMGQITKLTDALGNTETYHYDALGNMTEKADRDGQITQYAYNILGLLSGVKWADGREVSYKYTPLRRLCEVNDWTGRTKIAYDGMGNPIQITYPDERTLTFDYNSSGKRTRALYPDGHQVSYEYDMFDRLEKISSGDFSALYAYNKAGNVASRRLPDGSDIQYQYNDLGQLSRLIHKDAEGLLDDFTFEYDPMGRRKQYGLYRRDYPRDNGTYEYTYDPVGHLKKVVKDQEMIREYTYDALGNRSAMECFDPATKLSEKIGYEYDLRGGLLKMTGAGLIEEYIYDRRGNLTEQLKNGQTHRKFEYDSLNRLAAVQSKEEGKTTYQYNGLGYRTGMNSVRNGQETSVSYLLDYSKIYDNLVAKTQGTETEAYIWGSGLEGYTSDKSSGWFLTDPLGSVLRRTGADGSRFTANYDEFGNLSAFGADHLEVFGYNGFMFDNAAGTYFTQARQYRSQTGTFDAMDRFGGDITMPETLNPYVYCMYEPFGLTDKSGYWFGLDDAIAAGLGAIGGVVGQFVGDVITGVAENGLDVSSWKWSSWQEYTGAAIGGAAGGVTTLYAGPIAGGAVSGGVGRLATEGLTWASDPGSYDKSGWDVLKETALDTGIGAMSGLISKATRDLTKKLANTKPVKWLTSKLNSGGKIAQWLGGKLSDIATGKKSKQWSQLSKFLKNQHSTIAESSKLKQKLMHLMLTSIPTYIFQEAWGKVTDKINPFNQVKDWIKGKIRDELKKWLGLDDKSGVACASA